MDVNTITIIVGTLALILAVLVYLRTRQSNGTQERRRPAPNFQQPAPDRVAGARGHRRAGPRLRRANIQEQDLYPDPQMQEADEQREELEEAGVKVCRL